MPIIEANLDPSKRQLKGFGMLALAFFSILGVLLYVAFKSVTLPLAIWAVAAVLTVVYYAVPPFRLPIYRGWMHLVSPIGWVISHLLFGLIYFVLFTLIGWTLRLFGRNPIRKRFDSRAATYWVRHRTGGELRRYFNQY